jgi:hypothetical protein
MNFAAPQSAKEDPMVRFPDDVVSASRDTRHRGAE